MFTDDLGTTGGHATGAQRIGHLVGGPSTHDRGGEVAERTERTAVTGPESRGRKSDPTGGRCAEARGKIAEEPALADARRSDDQPGLIAALAVGRIGGGHESVEIGVAPQRRGAQATHRGVARTRGPRSDRQGDPDGLGAALDGDRSHRLELDAFGDRERGGLAEEDAAGGCGRLESGGGVHRVAAQTTPIGAAGGMDDLAGRDADTDREGAQARGRAGPRVVRRHWRSRARPGPRAPRRRPVPWGSRTPPSPRPR